MGGMRLRTNFAAESRVVTCSGRHRAAHVESQIVPLFSQSLTISGVESVLNDARRRYEKYIVLGQ